MPTAATNPAGPGEAARERSTNALVRAGRKLRSHDESRYAAPAIYHVHPPKTAGTTVRRMLQARGITTTADGMSVQTPIGHDVTLDVVMGSHPGSKAFFFVREPLTRYVSGFNSRLRQGAPAHNNPWRGNERRLFEVFSTLNDMAEALTCNDSERRDFARYGMSAVAHLPRTYGLFFQGVDYLERHVDRLFFVGFVETFDDDVATLFRRLGQPAPDAPDHIHSAPTDASTALSEIAKANLREWYANDIKIYDWLLAQRERWSLPPA